MIELAEATYLEPVWWQVLLMLGGGILAAVGAIRLGLAIPYRKGKGPRETVEERNKRLGTVLPSGLALFAAAFLVFPVIGLSGIETTPLAQKLNASLNETDYRLLSDVEESDMVATVQNKKTGEIITCAIYNTVAADPAFGRLSERRATLACSAPDA